MTAIEQAIKEAIEKGGYCPLHQGARIHHLRLNIEGKINPTYNLSDHVFLEPEFWQALGKAREWDMNKHLCSECGLHNDGWAYEWHRFIDHLAEGKDAESLFANL
jgi:hypothetical protein